MRIEKDFLGQVFIPENALYGIHSERARNNFPVSDSRIDPYFMKAYLLVKKACLKAAFEIGEIGKEQWEAIEKAVHFLIDNKEVLEKNMIVPALQGGAGTSFHMNINEVIANQALLFAGRKPGEYQLIHPNDTVNCCQSTNDTYPSALSIALIWRLRELTETVCRLQETLQEKEREFSGIYKIARTQMQDALPITLGMEFGAYAEAVSRDRWRLYKAEERLRVVNLGGTAVGTSMNAPRKYIFSAYNYLREYTGIGLAKSENLLEATSNQDVYLEAFGWVKVFAVNLHKIACDLRFLSSSPVGEVKLPKVQAGSSMMPGKVNPVIPELMIQIAYETISSDTLITQAVMNGHLELNPWLPVIASHFLRTLKNLKDGTESFIENCLKGIEADKQKCQEGLFSSYSILTSLNRKLGYEEIALLVKEGIESGKPIEKLLLEKKLLTKEEASDFFNLNKMTRQEKQ
ncbi:MAG TPA: aspartate ammonia-lyase [Spirochaetia bacterium]|nr:aspartate ammonia-lyase [Spirochaetia bacterium]